MVKAITRRRLTKLYESSTGLKLASTPKRIDILSRFIATHSLGLADINISNDPQRIELDQQGGVCWHSGVIVGDTCCLGYSYDPRKEIYTEAVFVQSYKIEL